MEAIPCPNFTYSPSLSIQATIIQYFTFIDVLSNVFMNVKIVLLIEGNFVAVEDFKTTRDGSEGPGEDIGLVVGLVSLTHADEGKRRDSEFLEHKVNKIMFKPEIYFNDQNIYKVILILYPYNLQLHSNEFSI